MNKLMRLIKVCSRYLLVAVLLALSVLPLLPAQQTAKAVTYTYSQTLLENTGNVTQYIHANTNISDNLTNFPFRDYMDASNWDFTQAKSDGTDITYFSQEGVELKPWIETYNATAQVGILWFTDNLTAWSRDRYVTKKWGNAGASNISNPVIFSYDPQLKAFWAFNELGGTTLHDYSGNGNNGVVQPSTATAKSDGVLHAFSYPMLGDVFANVPTGATVSSIDFYLKKVGTATGTANVTVRNATTNATIGVLGTISASTVSTNLTKYTFNSTPVVVNVSSIKITFEYSSGTGDGNGIDVSYASGATNSIGHLTYYPSGGPWGENNDNISWGNLIVNNHQYGSWPWWSSDGNQGLTFDGYGGSVNISASSSLNDVVDPSISMFIDKYNGTGGSGEGTILSKGYGLLDLNNLGNDWLQYDRGFSGGTEKWKQNTANIWSPSTNVSIIMRHDTSLGSPGYNPLWIINGTSMLSTSVASTTGTLLTDAANNLFIGNIAAESRTWNGTINDIWIWSGRKTTSWLEMFSKNYSRTSLIYRGVSPLATVVTNSVSGASMNATGGISGTLSGNLTYLGSQLNGLVRFDLGNGVFTPWQSTGLVTANFSYGNYPVNQYVGYFQALPFSDGSIFGAYSAATDNNTITSGSILHLTTPDLHTWSVANAITPIINADTTANTYANFAISGDDTVTYFDVRVSQSGPSLIKLYTRNSYDKGATLTAPIQVVTGSNNTQATEVGSGLLLRDGNQIMGAMYDISIAGDGSDMQPRPLLSTDKGHTWHFGGLIGSNPSLNGDAMFVESANGTVRAYLQSTLTANLGQLYRSDTSNDGVTWSTPVPSGISAASAPMDVKRVSFSPDVVVMAVNPWDGTIYNPRTPIELLRFTGGLDTVPDKVTLANNADVYSHGNALNDHPFIFVNGQNLVLYWFNQGVIYTNGIPSDSNQGNQGKWYNASIPYLFGDKPEIGEVTDSLPQNMKVDKDSHFNYRIMAQTSGGTSYGATQQGTLVLTQAGMPTVVTGAITNVAFNTFGATLNGNVTSLGVATSFYAGFQYSGDGITWQDTPWAVMSATGSLSANVTGQSSWQTLYSRTKVRVGSVIDYGNIVASTYPSFGIYTNSYNTAWAGIGLGLGMVIIAFGLYVGRGAKVGE